GPGGRAPRKRGPRVRGGDRAGLDSGLRGVTAGTAARFQDRVAVVTGGGKGIGHAVASRLACGGAKVVISGRDEQALESACEGIRSSGGEAIGVVADVANPKD